MAYPSQPPAPPTMGSANTVFNTQVRFDPSYLKTSSGIIKVVLVVFSFIAFVCVQASAFWSNGRGVFFNFVAALAFLYSGGMLLLYMFHVVEKYHNVKWLKIEMIVSVIFVFLYLIVSTIAVAFGSPAFSAAGVSSNIHFMTDIELRLSNYSITHGLCSSLMMKMEI
ncbi:CKLF-like MARVEL transmembrane domain-containing protein 4 isoform X1 [Achroia grisella]|uniref:CKLF-like MARVEL transmembrane domain-containing protein 4 isoform X1 n=1 Tax=Achroia grisella TaxID=688607 RepID=UPI0027D34CA5|nr:CKLF-like MARVEL transmembrane domain-containing protein 4 isoform X1 [Achroia grisella]